MKYTTAIEFYRTGTAIAAVLGIKPQAVYQWQKKGIVPRGTAYRLQALSEGKVKVEEQAYVKSDRNTAPASGAGAAPVLPGPTGGESAGAARPRGGKRR